MKTKKQILTALILLASILASFGHASWSDNLIPVEETYDVVTCSNVSKIYLNEDNDADNLPDIFFYLNSNFTLTGTEQDHTAGQIMRETNRTTYTKVKYYTPLQNMFYKISNTNQTGDIDNYTFWRASRVFPYNTPVRGIATTPNKVVFEQPSDNNPNKNIISIVYDYDYKYAVDFDGNTTSAYWYNQIPDMAYVGNNYVTLHETLPGSEGNRKRKWSAVHELEACRNYELNRCGDGKIDEYDTSWANEFTWETCDDGPNNGQPWYCDLTCGNWWGWFFCGDEIINDGSTETVVLSWNGLYYGPTYYSGTELIFETCDDGNDPNDPDGLYNEDGTSMFCSSTCFDNFTEAFVEVFINE